MIARWDWRGYDRAMDEQKLDSLIAELSELLRRQAGAKGADFETQLKRADRLLNRPARKGGRAIVAAQALIANPRTQHMVDAKAVHRGARDLRAHLKTLNPWDRRVGRVLGSVGAIAAGLIVLAAAVVTVLVWRGFL